MRTSRLFRILVIAGATSSTLVAGACQHSPVASARDLDARQNGLLGADNRGQPPTPTDSVSLSSATPGRLTPGK
jgi:hypothetical protein